MSAMEDAKIYTTEAPPDARHIKNVLYWYICLTLTIKGPETPADSILLGIFVPRIQLRLAQQTIVKRYPTAVQEDAHTHESVRTLVLYRCSWCSNPSAALRMCSGCEKARYCDAGYQKSHWLEHKVMCRT
ncbi:hypothetical protein C8R48DRAFT_751149 [Suillus tomentosus]|nr:hypothetical protein C8R48DRAFT_751149 [Suillus tomentosus]